MTVFSKPALIATIIFALAVTSSNPAAAKSGGVSHSAATTTTSQAGHVKNMKSRLWKGPIQKGVAWVKKVCRRSLTRLTFPHIHGCPLLAQSGHR